MKNIRIKVWAFVRFVPVYIIGCFLGIMLLVLRGLRIWKIEGLENLPTLEEKGDRGLLLVSNHPSLLDPLVLIGFFFPWYAFSPLRYGPWNMAEQKNYRRGLFALMEPRLVFLDRDDPSSGMKSFRKAKGLLEGGSIFILFAEGGRTFKGIPKELILETNGRKIRPFNAGAGLLATQTDAITVPVWIDGTDAVCPNLQVARYTLPRFWKRVRISFGKRMEFADSVRAKEGTGQLQTAVLGA